MLEFPDRIGALIRRLEAGQSVTRDDVSRMAALQALDIAKLGEDFVREVVASNHERLAAIEEAL